MDLQKFAKRAYLCALKRGKITSTTSSVEMSIEGFCGLKEEVEEVQNASAEEPSDHLPDYSEEVEEYVDVVIVALTELYRRGTDVEKVLHEKMKYNERRID